MTLLHFNDSTYDGCNTSMGIEMVHKSENAQHIERTNNNDSFEIFKPKYSRPSIK